MTIINYDGNNVMVIDREDKRLEHGVEDLFSADEFKEFFGIDYSKYVNVIYEPQRNFYAVHKYGEDFSESFDSPQEEPTLKKIDDQKQDILDYLVLRHMKQERPSPYHRLENFKYVLPEKHKKEYQAYIDEKEAWKFLQSTFWIAIRELEIGNLGQAGPENKSIKAKRSTVIDNIMNQRRDAQNKVSEEFMLKALGLTPSGDSKIKEAAGIDSKKPKQCSPEELKQLNQAKK
jgi:hypothetical protein